MQTPKTNFFQIFLLAALVSILSQGIHETGHMLVYQAYGRDPGWGFIGMLQTWDREPVELSNWVPISTPDGNKGWLRLGSSPDSHLEKLLEATAGPLASLVATLIGLWVAFKNRRVAIRQAGLMLALVTSFTMTAYYLRSPMRVIGDEFDIASQLSIPKAIVETTFGVIFFISFVLALRRLDGWRSRLAWLGAAILGGVTTGLMLNFAEQWIREMAGNNDPLARPVLGYALPVLVVHVLTILGIIAWGQYHTSIQSFTEQKQ